VKWTTDRLTTLFGGASGAGLLASVDWQKLAAGDFNEIGKAVAGFALMLFGYFANKRNKADKPKA